MKYELIILLNAEFSEEQIDVIIKKYEEYINKNNGEFIGAEKWGKRHLMGVSKSHKYTTEAYYVMINFEDTKHQLDKLNYKMKIDEEIIRHMISRKVEEQVVAS